MAKIDEAFEQVIGLAEKFKAILDVSEAVKEIGSLEQAISERKAARDAAVAAHENALRDLESVATNLDTTRKLWAQEEADHQRAMDLATQAAAAKSSALEEATDHRCRQMLSAAAEDVAQRMAKGEAAIAAAKSELAAIDEDIAAARQELREARDAHDQLLQKIEGMKNAARAVVG